MSNCSVCRKPGAESTCGVCSNPVCRKCRIFLDEAAFPFERERPAELKHTYYCGPCSDQHIEPFRETYEATLEAAKGVTVLFKDSRSLVRVLRRADKVVEIEGQIDRNDVIMYLAYRATQAGFNSIVDVEVDAKKIRNEGYQKSAWSGRGWPADVKSHAQE